MFEMRVNLFYLIAVPCVKIAISDAGRERGASEE